MTGTYLHILLYIKSHFVIILGLNSFSSIQNYLSFVIILSHWNDFSSLTQLCPIFCNPMNRSTPGLPVHHQLLEFTQTRDLAAAAAACPLSWWCHPAISSSVVELVMPSSHFILCRPLLLLPRIPPSIRVFSNESTLLMR